MTIIELAKAFLHEAPVGICITNADPTKPGPTILYVNPAFEKLTGRSESGIIGRSPRFMQGKETRRTALDVFLRALMAGERYHGYLTNYRGDGTKYRAEIDCRPVRGPGGTVEYFISFEREVTRRVGRPGPGGAGRYDPVLVSNELLTGAMRSIGIFSESTSLAE